MTVSSRSPLAAALLALVLVAGCASTSRDQEVQRLQARSLYEQALKSLQAKQISLTLSYLKEAVQLDPENPVFRNTLGVVFLDLGKLPEAEAELKKAVELDPSYAEAHHNLGIAFAKQGHWEQAVAAYKKALSLPIYATPEIAYYNLGLAYAGMGKSGEAEEALRTAIQLDSQMAAAYYQLGVVAAGSGRQDEAKALFRRARDLEPASPFGQAAESALKAMGEGS